MKQLKAKLQPIFQKSPSYILPPKIGPFFQRQRQRKNLELCLDKIDEEEPISQEYLNDLLLNYSELDAEIAIENEIYKINSLEVDNSIYKKYEEERQKIVELSIQIPTLDQEMKQERELSEEIVILRQTIETMS